MDFLLSLPIYFKYSIHYLWIVGEGAEAAGGSKTGAKTKIACMDPAYKPDEGTDE